MTDDPLRSEPEAWRPISGYDGLYDVSDQGRVRRNPDARGRGAQPGLVLSANGNGPRSLHQWVTLYRGGHGVKVYVHRAVAAAFLPGNASPVVRHLDDDPTNNVPSNLAWGTQADNVHDMVRAGRARGGKSGVTHCPKGHPYDGPNTYITKRGHRSCRACERNRSRSTYRKAA